MIKCNPEKTVVLLDGSSLMYRAYYGSAPMHTQQGESVQAVYTFIRMIKKLIATFSPQYMVLVWDSKGKTARHELFDGYKAKRDAAPSDLFVQKEHIVAFADLIGLCQITQTGCEADDILYSIATERSKEGDSVVVVTSDKDMLQMLTDKISVYDPLKDTVITPESFEKKWNFPVSKLSFYFSLIGDTSDNIPGVKGIGKTGAQELVEQFDSLADLYAHLKKVEKKRMKTALELGKDDAFLSEQLFLLHYTPSGLSKKDCSFNGNDWQKAYPLFEKLQFKSLLPTSFSSTSEVSASELHQVKQKQHRFELINTVQSLYAMIQKMTQAGAFGMDTETDGLDPLQANLVGISFACDETTAYYVPVGHKTQEEQLALDQVLHLLKPLLEDASVAKYLHNVKFDLLVLWTHGILLKGYTFDTMIMAFLVAQPWQKINLKDCSLFYLKETMLTFKEVVTNNGYKNFAAVPLELATSYAAADALQTFRLQKILYQKLEQEKLLQVYLSVEYPMIEILADMQKLGIDVDVPFLHDFEKKIDRALVILQHEMSKILGYNVDTINLNSPAQVARLLFEELHLPPQKKSAKKTAYSTDQEVLETLSKIHPVPAFIVKFRELAKLKNTYVAALPGYVNKKTGKIHTTYSQTVAATGRLASSDPNLQNIPTNGSGYGLEVRAAFKAPKGMLFLAADYSQNELRILAHLSQDQNLMKAFLHGQDIHAQTAAQLFDVSSDKVTHDQRAVGKRINFSILYGLTAYGLSKDLDIPLQEAKKYIDKYVQQYPAVMTWMQSVIDFAKKHGYVETVFGHRRYVPGIYEQNKVLYQEACRIAINTVAQGTAADIVKKGMINLDAALKKSGLGGQIVLQIHDELLLQVPEDQIEETSALVKKVLEHVVSWEIPLNVAMRVGKSWKEVTK